MNINDANLILDRHKEGTHVYSMLTITRALYITGDIQQEPESFGSDGKNTRMEGTRMDESEAA